MPPCTGMQFASLPLSCWQSDTRVARPPRVEKERTTLQDCQAGTRRRAGALRPVVPVPSPRGTRPQPSRRASAAPQGEAWLARAAAPCAALRAGGGESGGGRVAQGSRIMIEPGERFVCPCVGARCAGASRVGRKARSGGSGGGLLRLDAPWAAWCGRGLRVIHGRAAGSAGDGRQETVGDLIRPGGRLAAGAGRRSRAAGRSSPRGTRLGRIEPVGDEAL